MKRRPDGSGWVEVRPGRKPRARFRDHFGKAASLTCETPEEAERRLDGAMVALAADGPRGLTVGRWGESCLDQREAEHYRTMPEDRSRWRRHVASSWLAEIPIRELTIGDVVQWLDELARKPAADKRGARKLGRSTVRHCLVLLRRVMQRAFNRRLVAENVVKSVELPGGRTKRGKTTAAEFAYLHPEEVAAIDACDAVPRADRLRALFAIFTGLRQGEQWNLELRDLVVDGPDPHVMVRYGGPGHEPPKSGKVRRVPLFGRALDIAREWLAMLPRYTKHNPLRLAFPTPRGCRRQRSKVYGWHALLRAAGIDRPVRWHDLRHTCASHLIAGWWGRAWSMIEVRDFLGHADIATTQRYAHLAPTALRRAADETVNSAPPPAPPAGPSAEDRGGMGGAPKPKVRWFESNQARQGSPQDAADPESGRGSTWGAAREIAWRSVEAAAAADPAAHEHARRLGVYLIELGSRLVAGGPEALRLVVETAEALGADQARPAAKRAGGAS